MENTQKDPKLTGDEVLKENLRVQKTAYIKQQLERQRAAEDARLERLLQEQEVIEGLRESIDDSMWKTEETRKYNQEFQEHVNMQIYESHGITGDKLRGMQEYKNALYRGGAAALFFLSLMLTVLCGVLHGFQSDICILMFAFTAMEGALLSQEKKRPPVLDLICKVLYLLTFPTMLIMFVCYELKFSAYGWFLPYTVVLGTFVMILSTISYFLYDPYSWDKKKLRDAKRQIREIERLAEKEVRKKHKTREKEERNVQKLLDREERKNQLAVKKAESTENLRQKVVEIKRGFLARFKKPDKPLDEPITEGTEAETLSLATELPCEAEPADTEEERTENIMPLKVVE